MNPASATKAESARDLLRHTVATLAYRGGKAVRGASDSFASYQSGPKTRTPIQVLAHVNDLFDWAIAVCDGKHVWNNSVPQAWSAEVERFHHLLTQLDERLADGKPLGCTEEMLFQGPVADALTHVGQIAMLRRSAGEPIRGENYLKADIRAGQTGINQPPSVVEFD